MTVCQTCSVFFFKQKTTYEMRISDWSSDVCSSDLFFRSTPISFATALVASAYSWLQVSKRSRSVPISVIGMTLPRYAPFQPWHAPQYSSKMSSPAAAASSSISNPPPLLVGKGGGAFDRSYVRRYFLCSTKAGTGG